MSPTTATQSYGEGSLPAGARVGVARTANLGERCSASDVVVGYGIVAVLVGGDRLGVEPD